jgi:hypothetical protein
VENRQVRHLCFGGEPGRSSRWRWQAQRSRKTPSHASSHAAYRAVRRAGTRRNLLGQLTSLVCSSRAAIASPVFIFHSRTVSSPEVETRVGPAGKNSTKITPSVYSLRVTTAASHARTTLSPELEATHQPLNQNVIKVTGDVYPSMLATAAPESESQIQSALLLEREKKRELLGEHTTECTCLLWPSRLPCRPACKSVKDIHTPHALVAARL